MIRKRGNIVGKKEKASGSKKPLEMQHEILTEEEQEYVIDEIKEQSEKDLKQITGVLMVFALVLTLIYSITTLGLYPVVKKPQVPKLLILSQLEIEHPYRRIATVFTTLALIHSLESTATILENLYKHQYLGLSEVARTSCDADTKKVPTFVDKVYMVLKGLKYFEFCSVLKNDILQKKISSGSYNITVEQIRFFVMGFGLIFMIFSLFRLSSIVEIMFWVLPQIVYLLCIMVNQGYRDNIEMIGQLEKHKYCNKSA